MRFQHPDNEKVVVASNPATIAVLEANGWVSEAEEPKKKPGRPKKSE